MSPPVRGPDHLASVHAGEELIDEVASEAARLRAAGRGALGLGAARALEEHRSVYPLVAVGVLGLAESLLPVTLLLLAPALSAALGSDTETVLFAAIVGWLVGAALAPVVADRSTRKGGRGVMAAGAGVCGGVAFAGVAGLHSAVGLAPLLAVVGIAAGAGSALHRPLLADAYPPAARTRALAAYRAALALGIALAASAVHWLREWGVTWRGAVLTIGGLSAALSIMAVRLRDPGLGHEDERILRDAVREALGAEGGADRQGVDLPMSARVARRAVRVPTVRRAMAGYAALGVLAFPVAGELWFLTRSRFGLDSGARAAVIACVGSFVAVASLAAVPVLERLRQREAGSLVGAAAALLAAAALALAAGMAVEAGFVRLACVAVAFAAAAVAGTALDTVVLATVPARMRGHAAAYGWLYAVVGGGMVGLAYLGAIERRFGGVWAVAMGSLPLLAGALVVRGAWRTAGRDLDHLVDETVEREEIVLLRERGAHLPMLAARHVDFSYGDVPVLFDVSFTVDEGEMVALLGNNGAGKTTLLRVLTGLGAPTSGAVRLDGVDITALDAVRRVKLGISEIPGGRAVFGSLSVVENLRTYLFSLGRGRRTAQRSIEEAFAAFPLLGERRSQRASTLSGGERQMLALSKALLLRPRVLLIDELSLGLAPIVVADLLEIVRRINAAGTAVVIVEQSVNRALSLVDHVYFMEKGKIVFDGASSELLARPDLLRSAFLEGAARWWAG